MSEAELEVMVQIIAAAIIAGAIESHVPDLIEAINVRTRTKKQLRAVEVHRQLRVGCFVTINNEVSIEYLRGLYAKVLDINLESIVVQIHLSQLSQRDENKPYTIKPFRIKTYCVNPVDKV